MSSILVQPNGIVLRDQSRPQGRSAGDGEILAGAPVGEAIAAAAEASGLEDDALAAELQSWFRLWVAEGFFQAIA